VQPRQTSDVRRASGLPALDLIRDADRTARVRELLPGVAGSAVLVRLVRLAAMGAEADCGQLSLLSDQQVATAVRCADRGYAEQTSAIEDSLCSVTVLSGDVLVVADARAHPWLHDLPPVLSGAVVAYLGVPLRLADATDVGALCVYGSAPRAWTDRDVGLICQIADIVALELERLAQVSRDAAPEGLHDRRR
jgi:GAF domain-containing protein